jgi:epoxyqueuosine reductase
MGLEATIRDAAAALGFDACGFAHAAPLARDAFLAGWLDAGLAGEMRYLARRPERRLTVAGILPEARTVITLAYPYAPPPSPPFDWRAELRGRIAAYAMGEDYHRVVGRCLAALIRVIDDAVPGSRTRPYVDTGAVLEREWAVRGGLGWFGKNTMLLSTRAGSWFFLAELVTTVRLEPDPAESPHCGRCTSCLDACPTGALADGLVMDARRCISYLTIEHRGAIPPALRAHLGPWIFGCDVCQDVCPWNGTERAAVARHAPWLAAPAVPPAAAADTRAAWLHPSLPALMTLDETGFRTRFGRSAVARAKRRGLLRNAAVALGNSGNPAAVPALVGGLDDPEPLVRAHAAWGLGALGERPGRLALARRYRSEPDPDVAAEISAALERQV